MSSTKSLLYSLTDEDKKLFHSVSYSYPLIYEVYGVCSTKKQFVVEFMKYFQRCLLIMI